MKSLNHRILNRLVVVALGLGVMLALAPRAAAGCPGLPPIPAPGGQVTWTLAGSPYSICQDLTIPAGATVLVEPGVTIEFQPSFHLNVQGELLGQGTQAAPITISATQITSRLRVFGRMELDWTTVNCRVEPQDGGGSMIFRDTVFQADQMAMLSVIGVPTYVWDNPPLIVLVRCTWTGDQGGWEFLLDNSHVKIEDSTFTNTDVNLWDSYVWLDGVTVDGGALDLFFLNVDAHQDISINNVTVTNHAAGPGLFVRGTNALLGPDNVLQGNIYPVGAMGLLPGSVVPTTGNAINLIRAEGTGPGARWSKLAVPWLFDSESGCSSVIPAIEPGTTVKMAPDSLLCAQGTRALLRGTPTAPIILEPQHAGVPWQGVVIHVSGGSIVENVVIDTATAGIIVTNASGWIKDSVVRNCLTGANTNTYGILQAHKTLFQNNVTGVENTDTSAMWLDCPTAPNGFEGNTVAAAPSEFGATTDARHCWWGDPSGPTTPSNPGGTGDPIGGPGTVNYQPFVTVRPDYENHPPTVRLKHNEFAAPHALHGLFETGSKVIIEWSAEDDDAIVEQRVLFSSQGDFDADFQVVATLPPDARSFEWTVADVPFIVNGSRSFLRVAATDTAGQEGWDAIAMLIPSGDITAESVITSDFGGMTFRSGAALPDITYTTPIGGSPTFFFLFDGDEKSIYLGGGGNGTWSFTDSAFVSTDTARVGILAGASLNNLKWFFGEYFSLRPDTQIGDAPPSVTLLSPTEGASFGGGTVVPISWTASDDEGLHGFTLQASYDGGRTWHTLARDLPATTTSYDWPLPPSSGIPDVRVRVVAKDTRLQNSSDGSNRVFSITPGTGNIQGDLDGDGVVDIVDLLELLAHWGYCPPFCPADLTGDSVVNILDLLILLGEWT